MRESSWTQEESCRDGGRHSQGRRRGLEAVAVDTNILVRVITNDDPLQVVPARRLIEIQGMFIPTTVLLGIEWVLRFTDSFDRATLLAAMENLIRFDDAHFENEGCLRAALHFHRMGLDFADALHLTSSGEASSLATFDRKFVRMAKGLSGCNVSTPTQHLAGCFVP